MKHIVIIPARYNSSRFPGKPLAMINDKTMIQTVYLRVQKFVPDVYVATDDVRIQEHILDFGGKVVMTSDSHKSGTDRCAEAIAQIEQQTNTNFDIIINVQGDEPFVEEQQILKLIECFEDPDCEIATLIKQQHNIEDILNPNIVKVVINKNNYAIYFSRSAIPYVRDTRTDDWASAYNFYKHLGIYAYRKNILKQITILPQSDLELAESLEQNRWIENNYKIKVATTDIETISIDTVDDLNKIVTKKI